MSGIEGITIGVEAKRGWDYGAFNDFLHIKIFHSVKLGEDISGEVEVDELIGVMGENLQEHILRIKDRWTKAPVRLQKFKKLNYILVPADEDTAEFEAKMEEPEEEF
jgi:hypothetical protein